jgi:phospholipase/carboxylesterase
MNRLQQIAEELFTPHETSNYAVEFSRYSITTGETPHSLFTPMHYEPGYAYPLVVWLHGPGDQETQLKRVLPLVSTRNYVAVAPRGPAVMEGGGYFWPQTEDGILQAEECVHDSIDIARRKFNVSKSRIMLAGFGCGGTMALRIAMNHPEQFAAALSLGGPFPSNHSPLRRIKQVRGLPLFLATGRESRWYGSEQVCRDLRLFHSAGLQVTLRQYPCGDELTTNMLSDADCWIMEQVCPTVVSCQDAASRAADSTS